MTRFLYGWQRKCASIPLSLFMIGWIVYAVGFIWLLPELTQSPINFPYYLVLGGGPIVFLLGVLHTILPGVYSAFLWPLLALISVLNSVSMGWTIYASGLWLISSENATVPVSNSNFYAQTEFMFAGNILSVISWGIVLILVVYYKTRPAAETNQLNFNEFQRQEQTITDKLPFTPGKARLSAIILTTLSFIGWCMFILGYYTWRPDASSEKPDYYVDLYDSSGLPIVVIIHAIAPLLYLASLIHAGCLGSTGKVVGIFESIFSVLLVVPMGTVVIQLLRYYIFVRGKDTTKLNRYFYIMMLLGGVVSLFFWSLVLALWPFYGEYKSSGTGDGNVRHNVTLNDRAPAPAPAAHEGHPNYGAVPRQRRVPHDEQPLLGENGLSEN